jgi:hypothetical protein
MKIQRSGRDSKPQSWPPSDRRLFRTQTARLSRWALERIVVTNFYSWRYETHYKRGYSQCTENSLSICLSVCLCVVPAVVSESYFGTNMNWYFELVMAIKFSWAMLSTNDWKFLGHDFQPPHISPLITFPCDVDRHWLVNDHLTVPPLYACLGRKEQFLLCSFLVYPLREWRLLASGGEPTSKFSLDWICRNSVSIWFVVGW